MAKIPKTPGIHRFTDATGRKRTVERLPDGRVEFRASGTKARSGGGNPDKKKSGGNPKKNPGGQKKNMSKKEKAAQMFDGNAAGWGAAGGALARIASAFLGPGAGRPIGHFAAGALSNKATTRNTAHYIAGASVGDTAGAMATGLFAGEGNGNGGDEGHSGGWI